MESSVVSFIMENIILFLLLGTCGIVITIYLFFTGEKVESDEKENLEADYINISNYNLNVYVLVYLFIFFMMIFIGFFSDFITPVTIGAVIAIIPIILIFLIRFRTKKTKV